MALKGNSSSTNTELNFIGKGTHIEGKITTQSSIRIDGSIKGTLDCSSTVTIGESGKVDGDIKAQNAIIGGQVQGSVIVAEKLVLENKSSLIGELQAKKLIIDEGAVFDGTSAMGAQKPLKTAAVKNNESS